MIQFGLTLNGEILPFRITEHEGNWYTLETESAPMASGVNVLAFAPPYFVPVRFITPDVPDRRSLGIALATVTFRG